MDAYTYSPAPKEGSEPGEFVALIRRRFCKLMRLESESLVLDVAVDDDGRECWQGGARLRGTRRGGARRGEAGQGISPPAITSESSSSTKSQHTSPGAFNYSGVVFFLPFRRRLTFPRLTVAGSRDLMVFRVALVLWVFPLEYQIRKNNQILHTPAE